MTEAMSRLDRMSKLELCSTWCYCRSLTMSDKAKARSLRGALGSKSAYEVETNFATDRLTMEMLLDVADPDISVGDGW